MGKSLETMSVIMGEAGKEAANMDMMELDEEGRMVAEHKRYTLDIPEVQNDPLR